MNVEWLKRRWTDFRWGHGIYLGFSLSFLNFLLITYRLLIEHVPFLENMFPSLTIYGIVALLAYVPLAVIVGHFHRMKQLATDSALAAEKNPYFVKILKTVERIEKKLEEKE